jgi:thymidylate synthase
MHYRRRNPANRYGIYFERMIQYGETEINQLEHIIGLFPTVKRPTAYQLSIFDPSRDHTRQPLRGFPCLQQVNFAPLGMGKLALVANYPTQYLFEKAYGNYLGLYRLGRFVADQLKLDLTQMTCVVGKAIRGDRSKATLRSLLEQMQTIPGSTPPGQAVPVGSE